MENSVVIVDDEKLAASLIESYLTDYFPGTFQNIYLAHSLDDGISQIRQYKPQLVFLDIVIPGGTGFDIIEKIKDQDFKVIFFSGYSEFAIKAFRVSAVDFLMKPVAPEVFIEAVDKALEQTQLPVDYNPLLTNLKAGKPMIIGLASTEEIRYVAKASIIRFQSDGRYTDVFLDDGSIVKVSRILRLFDELLNSHGFFRNNRSHLVNLSHVDRFLKSNGGEIKMTNGNVVPLSRKLREKFFKAMANRTE